MTERGPRRFRAEQEKRRRPDGDGPEVDHVAQALENLQHGVEQIQTSDGFQQYLAAMGRFHYYSFNNVMLIVSQRPDAEGVASFKTWQSLGRHVNKGEHGIRILVPSVRKEVDEESGEEHERLTGFRTGVVFDIKQTDGEEMPAHPTAKLLESP